MKVMQLQVPIWVAAAVPGLDGHGAVAADGDDSGAFAGTVIGGCST
jgi:hypothetical protein